MTADDASRVVASGGGRAFDWANDSIRVKTPAAMTAGAVTVVEDTLKPGFHLPRHYHRDMIEVFYVLEGDVTFVFDDETVVATEGMVVNVLAEVRHEAYTEAGARMVTVFVPGGFDLYLADMVELIASGSADDASFEALGERYDIWPEPRS